MVCMVLHNDNTCIHIRPTSTHCKCENIKFYTLQLKLPSGYFKIYLAFGIQCSGMTNYEEILVLLIFIPCVFCIIAGIASMASYRCACCCPSSTRGHRRNRRSRLCPSGQEIPMTVFQLTQRSYRRLTQSTSSILDQSITNLRFEDHGDHNREVTEFDYRQTLHMECGVVALEPPPSYTMATKELGHQIHENSPDANTTQEQPETSENGDTNPSSIKESSLPPYEERERAGLGDRNWDIDRMMPGRNSDFIQLNVFPSVNGTELTDSSTGNYQ